MAGNDSFVTQDGGYLFIQNVAAPAAGAELIFNNNFTPHYRLKILAMQFEFVASAVVATRTVRMVIRAGANAYMTLNPILSQTAGLTITYVWAPGIEARNTGVIWTQPWPSIPIEHIYTVETLTESIDVGDQFGTMRLYLRRFRT